MSAPLQPGTVCASLDNGELYIVELIGAQWAHVRPVAGGPLKLADIDDLWPLLDRMP